jgi:hypothetical protein
MFPAAQGRTESFIIRPPSHGAFEAMSLEQGRVCHDLQDRRS